MKQQSYTLAGIGLPNDFNIPMLQLIKNSRVLMACGIPCQKQYSIREFNRQSSLADKTEPLLVAIQSEVYSINIVGQYEDSGKITSYEHSLKISTNHKAISKIRNIHSESCAIRINLVTPSFGALRIAGTICN